MNSIRYILLAIAILTLIASCSKSKEEQRKALTELIGKELQMQDSLQWYISGTEVKYDPADSDYRIIVYVDSAGCTTCKMKLGAWSRVMNDFKGLADVDVNFMMIIGGGAKAEATDAIIREGFSLPYCYDSTDSFASINDIPKENMYHTILLDSEDKVVAVGNPVVNPKIRKLYQSIMTGKSTSESNRFCQEPASNFGTIESEDTVTCRFSLVNTSESILSIQQLVPSCECVSATHSTDTIAPGKSTVITVKYIADSVSGQSKRYVDVFYNEFDIPERLTLHGFIINNHKTLKKSKQ